MVLATYGQLYEKLIEKTGNIPIGIFRTHKNCLQNEVATVQVTKYFNF